MNRDVRKALVGSARFFALVALVAFILSVAASSVMAAGCAVPFAAAGAPASSPAWTQPKGDEHYEPATIVGLWHAVYTATSAPAPPAFPPVPFQLVESFKTWHADGTEFENAFFAPVGGNICFGVWKEIKEGKIQLHHIGLMFDSTGAISNVFTNDEVDSVAGNGLSYSGYFVFKLYPGTDTNTTGTPLAVVKGTIEATRITIPDKF